MATLITKYSKAKNKYELDVQIRNYIEFTYSFTRYFYTTELYLQDSDPENVVNQMWEDGYLDKVLVAVKMKEDKIILIEADEFLGLFNQVVRKQYIIETKTIESGGYLNEYQNCGKLYLRYVLNI
jgi:hypothetical protein